MVKHSSDDLYLMAYEAVYMYVDEDASTYPEYQLTHQPVWFGDEEIETETAQYTRTTEDEWDEIVIDNGDSGLNQLNVLEMKTSLLR